MSNLNGGNVRSLMEAYHSIYEQPQEEMLTEEQIIVNEFCESWFQQCIDEDVDFSQYSDDVILEAMCEAFGQEMGTPTKPSAFAGIGSWFNKNVQAWKDRGVSGKVGLNQKPTQPAAQPTQQPTTKPTQQGVGADRRRFRGSGYRQPTPTPNPAATSRPATPAPAGAPKDVIVKAAKGGVPGTLNKTTGKWTASAPATPAPTGTKPTTPAGGAVADQNPAAPAKRPSILSGLDDLKKMRMASQIRQKTGAPNITSDMIGDKSIKAPTPQVRSQTPPVAKPAPAATPAVPTNNTATAFSSGTNLAPGANKVVKKDPTGTPYGKNRPGGPLF